MATNLMSEVQSQRQTAPDEDLLLRELTHRCSNDLQMVVGLLSMQSKRVQCEKARVALTDAMERVAVLARSRAMLQRNERRTLEAALLQVCEALQAQAEPRGILVSFTVSEACDGLPQQQITTLALIVNELITNAIKHAFHEGSGGRIQVAIVRHDGTALKIMVEDDGSPFDRSSPKSSGFGLDLVTRLMASIGGLLIPPANGSKSFELCIPRPKQLDS